MKSAKNRYPIFLLTLFLGGIATYYLIEGRKYLPSEISEHLDWFWRLPGLSFGALISWWTIRHSEDRKSRSIMACMAISILANELAVIWAVDEFMHTPMDSYHKSWWQAYAHGVIPGAIGAFVLSLLPNILERNWRIRKSHLLLWLAGPIMGWVFIHLERPFEFLDYASWFLVIGGLVGYSVRRRDATFAINRDFTPSEPIEI